MFTFGVGSYGKLGHGNDSNQLVPKLVEELDGERVVSLSCGADHMAALNSTALPPPLQAEPCQAKPERLIVAHLCLCVTVEGDVFTWGCGGNGRLGHGSERDSKKPVLVKGMNGLVALTVECGGYHMGVTTRMRSSPLLAVTLRAPNTRRAYGRCSGWGALHVGMERVRPVWARPPRGKPAHARPRRTTARYLYYLV